MAHARLILLAAGLWSMSGVAAPGQPPGDPHLPMPPGFDFPAAEATLLKMRDSNDVAGMRTHAWMVFAGMTKATPAGEAIWETWWPSDETFNPGGIGPSSVTRRRPLLRAPRQLSAPAGAVAPLAVGSSSLSFVMFNPEGHKYIVDNKLFMQSELNTLNKGGAVDIVEAPREAMSLKAVWWPIAGNALSPLPVWDNEPTKPIENGASRPTRTPASATIGNDSPTWKRVVAIDATRTTIPDTETGTVRFFDPSVSNPGGSPMINRPGARVIPLNRLYHFILTASDIKRFGRPLENEFISIIGRSPRPGDAMALVALHYTTKEIKDWVWATFWWHDKPDDGEFGAHRPAQVTGPWRNYRMDVAYSMDTPVEADGTPNAAFNPWLEAGFSNGVKSNCMTCHQQAVWPLKSASRPFLPITRGALNPADPFFKGHTRLDFLWSVALEARP